MILPKTKEIEDEFGLINLFSGIDNSQDELGKYLVYSRLLTPYIEFNNKHYFSVSQYSLSESTYEYWNKINIVSNPTGSIFDKIPYNQEISGITHACNHAHFTGKA